MPVDEIVTKHQTAFAAPSVNQEQMTGMSPTMHDQRQSPQNQNAPQAQGSAPQVYARPPTPVPGLWSVAVGGSSAGIVNMGFFVDDEVAAAVQRWSQREVDLEYARHFVLCIRVQTDCYV